MKRFFGVMGMAQLASMAGAIISGMSIVYLCEAMEGNNTHNINNAKADIISSEELTTEIVEEPTGNVMVGTGLVVEITSEIGTTTVHEITEVVSEDVTEKVTEKETQKATEKETTTKKAEKKTEKETTTAKKKKESTTKKVVQTTTKFAGGDISAWINKKGNTVDTRFKLPKGYTRLTYEKGSYADYVRNLPLEYYGRKMYEYNGKLAENQNWNASVIKTEFHSKGWLQCADCVMKLLGDYLYDNGRADEIVFDLANGKRLSYSSGGDYEDYMSDVYMMANTTSLRLQEESVQLSLKDIFPGAYFIMDKDKSHEYGHAVFVIDVAKNDKGEVAFLLAQGSTPSQDMHIFLNPLHPDDPWYYSSEIGSTFKIPGWTFKTSNLYYYEPIGKQKGIIMEETTTPMVTTSKNEEKISDEETTVAVETDVNIDKDKDETTDKTIATDVEATVVKDKETYEEETTSENTDTSTLEVENPSDFIETTTMLDITVEEDSKDLVDIQEETTVVYTE